MELEPLEILQNKRRRYFLETLTDLGGEATLREVVRRVSIKINGDETTKKFQKNVHISLIQSHIPKMERAGLIKYDIITDTVHLMNMPSKYKVYFDVVHKNDISWSTYYLIFSIISVAVSLLFFQIVSLIISVFFVCISLIHANQTHGITSKFSKLIKRKSTKKL